MPAEGGTATAPPVALPVVPSLAALLSGHIIRDGEMIQLVLRPSRWFILLSSLRFLAAVAVLMALVVIFDEKLGFRGGSRQFIDAGLLLMCWRLMWATLQWLGRLYILTDMRIIRITGVFTMDLFDCPLRKVARTLLEASVGERVFRIGSIVIIPQDEDRAPATWRMIASPRAVHEQVLAAIARAKQGGHCA